MVVAVVLAHGEQSQVEAAAKRSGGGKGREVLYLFGNRHETNKQYMLNNWILLYAVPANSMEHSCLNSGML